MTRFIFIADTHYGSTEEGYQQQKRYPYNISEIVKSLDNWIQEDPSIDFVLHGGDMIDRTSKENILNAAQLFNLSVPVYLCLGNHDLTEKNALDMWLSYASNFFPEGKPDYIIHHKDVTIYVIPNQWCEHSYYWENELSPHFNKDQAKLIVHAVKRENSYNDYYQEKNKNESMGILCTHGVVMGVPAEQTGFDMDIHVPPESFRDEVRELLKLDPGIKCVLSGHSHINTNVNSSGVSYITASSLTEVPFEFKLIEADSSMLKISTIPLVSELSFKYEYNYNRTYVQGREKDRVLNLKFSNC